MLHRLFRHVAFYMKWALMTLFIPAAGMDSSDDPLAREPNPGEDRERPAGQTGGLQRLPHRAQTTQGTRSGILY